MTMHFSHRHPLCPTHIQEDDEIICSGCELTLSAGLAYKCSKTNCEFYLDELCFELPRDIRHNSHPKHPLVLLSSPCHGFTCSACGDSCTAFFNYHCQTCEFGAHVECAALPEMVKIEGHEHPLTLICSLVDQKINAHKQDKEFICNVCDGDFPDGCWVYYCKVCQCAATHLDCAIARAEDHEPHLQ
ncbi:hypothetical protein FEM48_Zijuj01G0025500 [Ziziphus jujuba var. spinosa]|uniref:DC1 domain-containing protein n=2 Tax=Ziziphus jujuba TaxID=326968 RepID=A0A978VYM3_ZIZJJ|nr:hypothetical protein FEM48_Zijuj01G0025500 [Ziziphus jujuba var. spinosa]